jgi:hypothetical protein
MKNILCVIAICAIVQSLAAQKIIEKHIDFSGKKMISMNLEIADSIRIVTWNKNEVYMKASISINNDKNNEDYKLNFDEGGSSVTIHSKFEFEKGKNCCSDSDNCHCNCNCHEKIYFDLFVPENAAFSVETINGDITISGKTSQVRAHSISGFIDLTLASAEKADLKMNTISGTMYTNFELSGEKNLRRAGGSSISTILNGGGERSIDLETISGDIFLRKGS